MLWDEMKIKYLPMPTYIPLGMLWLSFAITVKIVVKADQVEFVMIAIPVIPLIIIFGFMILFLIVNLVVGPIRWN